MSPRSAVSDRDGPRVDLELRREVGKLLLVRFAPAFNSNIPHILTQIYETDESSEDSGTSKNWTECVYLLSVLFVPTVARRLFIVLALT